MIFNSGVTSACYNCWYSNSLLPEVATWVAATSQWLLCNNMTSINPSPLVGLLINFMHSIISNLLKSSLQAPHCTKYQNNFQQNDYVKFTGNLKKCGNLSE